MKEIIIIETQNGKKVKDFLEQEHENYKVYYENEEETWRQDARLAAQDKEREKELKDWDKITSKIDDE